MYTEVCLPDSPNRSILTRLLRDSRTKALKGKGSKGLKSELQAHVKLYYYTLLR